MEEQCHRHCARGGDAEPSGTVATCEVCHSSLGITMALCILVGCGAGALAMRTWMNSSGRRRGEKRKAADFDIGAPGQYVNSLRAGGPRRRGLAALEY
jgi:hypothetical protein